MGLVISTLHACISKWGIKRNRESLATSERENFGKYDRI